MASGVKNIFVRTSPISAVIPMGFPGGFGDVFFENILRIVIFVKNFSKISQNPHFGTPENTKTLFKA